MSQIQTRHKAACHAVARLLARHRPPDGPGAMEVLTRTKLWMAMADRSPDQAMMLYELLTGAERSPLAGLLLSNAQSEPSAREPIVPDLPQGKCFHGCLQVFGELVGAPLESWLATIRTSTSVNLAIDCYGGDSLVAADLFDALVERDVSATVVGACYSSAVFVLMGCERRQICADAQLMVHSPVAAAVGTPGALRAVADKLENDLVRFRSILAARIGSALADELLDGRDHWFNAEEAVKVGLGTEIIPASEPPALAAPDSDSSAPLLDASAVSLFSELLDRMRSLAPKELAAVIQAQVAASGPPAGTK